MIMIHTFKIMYTNFVYVIAKIARK